ncbi:hypothetical protein ES708_31701 [subsurface metagenome]
MNPDYKDIIKSVDELHKLQQQAVNANMPYFESKVNSIVGNKIKDENRICHLLDALLDLAFDDELLVLFKKLCRHYYFINKEAAFDYVNAYREMWDADTLNTIEK